MQEGLLTKRELDEQMRLLTEGVPGRVGQLKHPLEVGAARAKLLGHIEAQRSEIVHLVILAHAGGVLSEWQAAKWLGVSREEVRRVVDAARTASAVLEET